jgi:hypothetical protein
LYFLSVILLGGGLVSAGIQLVKGELQDPVSFFSAGLSLLAGFLLVIYAYLKTTSGKESTSVGFFNLVKNNLKRNRKQSFLVIVLLSLATFIVVSTGANRKDLFSQSDSRSSGTGGFDFFAESSLPILFDLNDKTIQRDYGIEDHIEIVQFRTLSGDDASCLNLNRVQSPRILGVDSRDLEDRFEFAKSMFGDPGEFSWRYLSERTPGGHIPAIADQTVIQWGLGLKVGDTLVYLDEKGDELVLQLVAGLANSVFQGNILIEEEHFIHHFPASSGSNIFLIDHFGESLEKWRLAFLHAFRDHGLFIQGTGDRLAEFNTVENTYLTIFLVLGGLGLVLGTIGLSILMARNLLQRRKELGLYRALGFSRKYIRRMVHTEYLVLLILAVIAGVLAAFIATISSWLHQTGGFSPKTAGILVLLILVNGAFWIILLSGVYIKNKKIINALRNE